MEEAERLAHRIVVINTGTVIAEGTAAELKDRMGCHDGARPAEVGAVGDPGNQHVAERFGRKILLISNGRGATVPAPSGPAFAEGDQAWVPQLCSAISLRTNRALPAGLLGSAIEEFQPGPPARGARCWMLSAPPGGIALRRQGKTATDIRRDYARTIRDFCTKRKVLKRTV
jgi:hypothetical protein